MKRYLLAVFLLLIALWSADYMFYYSGDYYLSNNNPISCISSIVDGALYLNDDDGYHEVEIRGVNLGQSKPGHYSADHAITKEDYLRWFKSIQELGANVIRVYTIESPAFYESLYQYNTESQVPLYLLHGVNVDEYLLNSSYSVYDSEFYEPIFESCKSTVDVIHGRFKLRGDNHLFPYHYKWDVSPWVYGYIIGTDWNNDLVVYTNDCIAEKEEFEGEYLYTKNANNFEIFLADVGNAMISYETDKYATQHAVSFANWPSTSPLPLSESVRQITNTYGNFDMEHIHARDTFQGGIFASYHVFPFAPEYVLYEERFKNTENSYLEYLNRLTEHHKMPVIIAEFGVPSSRGKASYEQNRIMHRDQGNLNENQQGNALVSMYQDIESSGCAGGIAYLWQDEWFKRTWNTLSSIDLENNIYWSDVQSSEPHYGLLSFDPGAVESICYVDGKCEEWTNDDVVYEDSLFSLSSKYDLQSIYFLVKSNGPNSSHNHFFIPLDITPQSGSTRCSNLDLNTSEATDFIVEINGKNDSRVWVQRRYSSAIALYGSQIYHQFNRFLHPQKDGEHFEPIIMPLREKNYYHQGHAIPFSEYQFNDSISYYTTLQNFETGKLHYGNGNPNAFNFDSLADFCYGEDFVEIRIPWQLLNFSDPSHMKIHDDYYAVHGVEYLSINHMYIGVGDGNTNIEMIEYPLDPLGKEPQYHERLKKSYYILQDYWTKHPAQ